MMEKLFYPPHRVPCVISGPSCGGKSVFSTNSILNIINDIEKIYIYSPSIHKHLYQKVIKCFVNYKPINILQSILYEEDFDLVIEEVINHEDFKKSNIATENYGGLEVKIPRRIRR